MKKKRVGIALILAVLMIGAIFLTACSRDNNNNTGTNNTEPNNTGQNNEPEEDAVLIRLVVPSPSGDPLTTKDEDMAERFNARAGGKYEMKVYGGGALAAVPEYLDAVRTGAVEMFDAAPPIFAGADARLNGLILPGLFETGEAIYAVQDELADLYSEIFEEKFNQKVLALLYIGAFDLFNTKKPIITPDDMKGILIAAPDPGIAATINIFGGTPITVPWPDFYSSLDKGVVDGVLNSLNGTINNKLTDMCKYYTDLYIPPSVNIYSINLDVYNDMPEDIRQALVEEARATANATSQQYIEQREIDIETLYSLDVEVHRLTEDEKQEWLNLCAEYTQEELAKYGDFGTRLKEIADRANASVN